MKMKEKPKKENSERWLLTYSDLMNLLMILFILLYAISSVDAAKYEQISETLNESMGEGASIFSGGASDGVFSVDGSKIPIDLGGGKGDDGSSGGNPGTISPTQAAPTAKPSPTAAATATPVPGKDIDSLSPNLTTKQDMEYFQEYVNAILVRFDLNEDVTTYLSGNGLTITFRNDAFFDSGRDVLKKEMKVGLDEISTLLNKVNNNIMVEGNTDNVPISSGSKFDSNWQLSSARAANVAQYLVEEDKVAGKRVTAAGCGEFNPIASNKTAAGRSKNRRVDIKILYLDASQQELNQ